METMNLAGTGLNGRSNLGYGRFMRQLLKILGDFVEGDFSGRLPSDWTSLEGRVAENINRIASRMEFFNSGLLELRHQVGEEGKIGKRLAMGDSVGSWAE